MPCCVVFPSSAPPPTASACLPASATQSLSPWCLILLVWTKSRAGEVTRIVLVQLPHCCASSHVLQTSVGHVIAHNPSQPLRSHPSLSPSLSHDVVCCLASNLAILSFFISRIQYHHNINIYMYVPSLLYACCLCIKYCYYYRSFTCLFVCIAYFSSSLYVIHCLLRDDAMHCHATMFHQQIKQTASDLYQ